MIRAVLFLFILEELRRFDHGDIAAQATSVFHEEVSWYIRLVRRGHRSQLRLEEGVGKLLARLNVICGCSFSRRRAFPVNKSLP